MLNSEIELLPFLKWAGGKRWLAPHLAELAPKSYKRFMEPFLGSGAAFFALQPASAILSDLNEDLINCYVTIRDDWQAVYELLERHDEQHNEQHYYRVRNMRPRSAPQRAARFIYLNRTCWNGLYRVNLDGQFNVPIGTKEAVVLDSDDFEATAHALQAAKVTCCDFEQALDCASSDDFVFVDPPYTVRHNYNGFIKYNEKLFSWDDQRRLHDAAARAAARGAKVLITNANHPSVRELYSDFPRLSSLSRKSILAADSEHRSTVSELLIQSWHS